MRLLAACCCVVAAVGLPTASVNSLGPALHDAANVDLILPPAAPPPAGHPQKLMVFIPGANVPTANYNATMLAIQAAAAAPSAAGLGLANLWVVVPAISTKKCIMFCPSTALCSPLNYLVQNAINKAKALGYKAATTAPDAFIAGHSLGGVCADTLARSYTQPPYAATLLMGSYPKATAGNGSLGAYPTPVLALGAELDGGLGRAGKFATLLAASDAAAAARPAVERAVWQQQTCPVIVLPGLDHSSFCPGFHVPGDVWPAEADNSTALGLIAEVATAFMAVHARPTSSPAPAAAMASLSDGMNWTRQLLGPMADAFALESAVGDTTHQAPWCDTAQRVISGLDAGGVPRVAVDSAYFADSHDWEHSRVHYSNTSTGVLVNVTGYNDAEGTLDSCIMAVKQIGCKMASADRIAQQLGLNASQYNGSRTCADVNRHAVAVAMDLLNETDAGRASLARYARRGRPFCFGDDFEPFEKIGPLFVSGSMKFNDNGTCLSVASIAISNTVQSSIFPGVHYCKVLSPARAMDYMLTDALKPKSGCLNI